MKRVRSELLPIRLRERLDELPVWLFAAWAALLVVRVHWPYILQPSEQSVDEGYLIAIGQRMLHGRMLPFVDGVAHSGPVFLFTGALIAAFGEFSWVPIRIAAMLGFAATSALSFACGRRAGRPVAGAIAAAAVPFYATLRMEAYDGIAYNAELPALVFTLAGLYACVRALGDAQRPVSHGWLMTAGLFTSCGALSKQVAALLVLPLAGYVIIGLLARDELATRQRIRLLLTYFGAAALAPLLLFARFAAAGALKDIYYYLVTYNSGPYMFPYRDASLRLAYKGWLAARPLELALCLTAISWSIAQVVAARGVERSWLQALRRSNFDLAVGLMAIGGVVGARASMRDFDHYYLLVLPGFSLVIGSLLERATASMNMPGRPRLAVVHRALLVAPLVLTGEVAWDAKAARLTAWSTQHMRITDLTVAHAEPPVCQFVRDHSAANDPVFVWGFRAQLYVSCARRPASRFVFTTFVAGYVPYGDHPKEIEDTLAVPGSRALLLAELEQSKPPIIVDAARTMAMRSLRRYGEVLGYVDQHYRSVGVIGDDEVWLRRQEGQARNVP